MDLLKLRYFYTVAELEHVTKAAEKLHVAQPAITKTVKLLENELGVPLFSRVGRGVKLTDYGKMLKEKLDGVFPIDAAKTLSLTVTALSLFICSISSGIASTLYRECGNCRRAVQKIAP